MSELIVNWLTQGHQAHWAHDANHLTRGELCFFLSYSRIVPRSVLVRHQHNLVVHASDLPRGRGMSPLTWQILEGTNKIVVTLLEAEDVVDTGVIYLQTHLDLDGTELLPELRNGIARATKALCMQFIDDYPSVVAQAREQTGEKGSLYRRRGFKDSQVDPFKSLEQQFNLLRVVDNECYPAWFEYRGRRYVLYIESRKQ